MWGERIRFLFGNIGGFEATVLTTGLRDIRSPNQYKIIRVSGEAKSNKQRIF